MSETDDNFSSRDVLLHKCDLVMARDEIANMHKMDGAPQYLHKDYASALSAFCATPSVETATNLLEVAPPLLQFFEMCSPGTDFYETARSLKKRGLFHP